MAQRETIYYTGYLSSIEDFIEAALDAVALRETNGEIAGEAADAMINWLMRNETERVKDRYPEFYDKWDRAVL